MEIREIGVDLLSSYAAIPDSFKVESEFRVELIDKGLGGMRFVEEKITPYIKWDDQSDEKLKPESWPEHFDINKMGVFMAFKDSRPVGGAAVLIDVPAGMITHFEKEGTAVLWDIRVHPDDRRRGIGSMLFKQAVDWAKRKGCVYLKIETQNVNVPACRFYSKNGCVLGAIHRYGYASVANVAHESMLLWYLDLKKREIRLSIENRVMGKMPENPLSIKLF